MTKTCAVDSKAHLRTITRCFGLGSGNAQHSDRTQGQRQQVRGIEHSDCRREHRGCVRAQQFRGEHSGCGHRDKAGDRREGGNCTGAAATGHTDWGGRAQQLDAQRWRDTRGDTSFGGTAIQARTQRLRESTAVQGRAQRLRARHKAGGRCAESTARHTARIAGSNRYSSGRGRQKGGMVATGAERKWSQSQSTAIEHSSSGESRAQRMRARHKAGGDALKA